MQASAPAPAFGDALPPEPSEPAIVQTMRWISSPLDFLDSCRRRLGNTFSLRFVGFQRPMVLLSDPDAIRALYSARDSGLPPGRTVGLRPVMGPRSVLLLEGQEHLARRRLMLPPFHGERMRAYEDVIREVAEREIASWPRERAFAIHPRMQAVTLEVIMRAVFGVTDRERLTQLRIALRSLLDDTASSRLQLSVLVARRLGRSRPAAGLDRLTVDVDELLAAEIAEHRADPASARREDILSQLMTATFADGEQMSDGELRDQLVTLLLAGHETTATALAWTFDLLLRHPPQLARLRAEVEAGSEDAYMRAVVSESLRLRPVVPIAGRRLGSELRVSGYTLPAGTDVAPSIWLTHTREDVYAEPLAFRPERFLENPPTTYSWIPFGGGSRRCLGASFAELEMRVVLGEVLRSCELRSAATRPERVARRNVTLAPRRGTRVIVLARPPAGSEPRTGLTAMAS
jgi:cytochrome P450 family 135